MKIKSLLILLILFGMGGSSFAKEHDFTLYPPRIPEPRTEEAEPINLVPPIFAQTNTFCAANLACTITGVWSFATLTVSGTTTLSGGGSLQGTWSGGPSYTISTVSETGNVVTAITATPCSAITAAFQSIVVSGVGVSGYNTGPTGLNGFFTLGACAGSTFTYFNPTSGLGASSGGTVTLSPIVSQGLTHTGPETISGQLTMTNHNNIFWAGPGPTPTIDQAVSACGTNSCIVEISPGYTGAESALIVTTSLGYKVYSGANNVTVIDHRQVDSGAGNPGGTNLYGIMYGGRNAGALNRIACNYYTNSPSDSTTCSNSFNWITGTFPSNGGGLIGAINLALTHDSVTVGSSPSGVIGTDSEVHMDATSSDNPLYSVSGFSGFLGISRTNATQNILDAAVFRSTDCQNISSAGAKIYDCLGIKLAQPTGGTYHNFSGDVFGNLLFEQGSQIFSNINGATASISSIVETNQTITVTMTAPCSYAAGQWISISGVTDTYYNSGWNRSVLAACSGSTFTLFRPGGITHTSSSGGTVITVTPQQIIGTTTNQIIFNPLSDSQGWRFKTQGGSDIVQLTNGGIFATPIIGCTNNGTCNVGGGGTAPTALYLVETALPSGVASQAIFADDPTTHTPSWNVNNIGASSPTGAWQCTNVTPVTTSGGSVTTDQNMMACTIPAGTLNRVGRTLRVKVAGIYSTAAASTSQMTVKVKICSVSGCASGNVLTALNIQSTAIGTLQITNDNFSLRGELTTQTAGAALAQEAHGEYLIDLAALTVADNVFGDGNTATQTGTPSAIDSTAQNFLQVTMAFSVASASNVATQRQLIAETVN